MTDRIGVLGESAGTTVGFQTVYAVPTGKAAKGKLFFRFTAGASTVVNFYINGILIAATAAMTSGRFAFSIGSDNILMVQNTATAPDGLTAATTVAPSGVTFMLSAGDLVQYEVVTAALLAANCQFVGTEIDV